MTRRVDDLVAPDRDVIGRGDREANLAAVDACNLDADSAAVDGKEDRLSFGAGQYQGHAATSARRRALLSYRPQHHPSMLGLIGRKDPRDGAQGGSVRMLACGARGVRIRTGLETSRSSRAGQ